MDRVATNKKFNIYRLFTGCVLIFAALCMISCSDSNSPERAFKKVSESLDENDFPAFYDLSAIPKDLLTQSGKTNFAGIRTANLRDPQIASAFKRSIFNHYRSQWNNSGGLQDYDVKRIRYNDQKNVAVLAVKLTFNNKYTSTDEYVFVNYDGKGWKFLLQ